MLRIKVCGMKNRENIIEVAGKDPDILGFIFYEGSKRFVGSAPDEAIFNCVPEQIEKAGVFVNEDIRRVLDLAGKFNLQMIQLHGGETPDYCSEIRAAGFKIIKSFGMNRNFDFNCLLQYRKHCDFFLFDTYTDAHGGSGKQFEWKILDEYTLDVPFLLSGGIRSDDVLRIKGIEHPMLYAVDINSKFEKEPGLKDPERVGQFIDAIRKKV